MTKRKSNYEIINESLKPEVNPIKSIFREMFSYTKLAFSNNLLEDIQEHSKKYKTIDSYFK